MTYVAQQTVVSYVSGISPQARAQQDHGIMNIRI